MIKNIILCDRYNNRNRPGSDDYGRGAGGRRGRRTACGVRRAGRPRNRVVIC